MYTLKGELKVISPTQQVSDSFKKREFVVVDASGQYAQTIQFQAVQDRCELLDKYQVGQSVEVTFFLRGREWTNPKDGKVVVFNTLDAWKVEAIGSAPTAQSTAARLDAAIPPANGDDSDLPF